jgi:hypothetical protein
MLEEIASTACQPLNASYEALTKEPTVENAVPGTRHYAQKYNSKESEECVDSAPLTQYVSAN